MYNADFPWRKEEGRKEAWMSLPQDRITYKEIQAEMLDICVEVPMA
jgi:hypothetical protein